MRIRPTPTREEAAAIVAALEASREKEPEATEPRASRWELSGRLGRMVPPGRKLEGSPWSYANWEGKT